MLVDVPLLTFNPMATVLNAVAAMNSRRAGVERIEQGVYLCGHWSFEHETSTRLETWPDLPEHPEFNAYGVCDSKEQLFEKFPILKTSERRFAVSFVSVKRADQEPEGGWRWHKWGPYIGEQNPQHEYLFDDTHIDLVFTYHVYEVKQ